MEPKPPVVEDPNAPEVLFVPKPPEVLPPPNKPPEAGVVLFAPKVVGLAWPKIPPPVLPEPNPDVVVLFVDPKPPNVEPVVPLLPPNNPPPVVPLPNGFEPKAVVVLLLPKAPGI